jgi:hypothetical protein
MATDARPHDRPRLPVRVTSRLRSEAGIALPATVIMLFIIASISAAVATSALSANTQSVRDRSVKRSVAAADAGLQTAIYRLNKLKPAELLCTIVGATGLEIEPVQADGWCRAQSEDLGEGAQFSYRVDGGAITKVNGQELLQRKIVATGTVNGVQRRVMGVVGSSTGRPLFGGYAVISLSDLNMPNSTIIAGNAGTNGNISLTSSAELCGNATFGPGKHFSTSQSGHLCSGFFSQSADQPFVLNPVDQGNAATANNNDRIGVLDPWTDSSKIVWNPSTRVLKLQNISTLTLTGDVYSFCYLEISNNATLIIGPRASGRPPLKIYIDAPENCGSVSGRGNVKLQNGASITNLNTDPTSLFLNLVGSSTVNTSVSFENNFEQTVTMLIYAPKSTVLIQNYTNIFGAIAAKSVQLQNNTKVTWHEKAGDVTVDDLFPLYQRQDWKECEAKQPGSVPDSGC